MNLTEYSFKELISYYIDQLYVVSPKILLGLGIFLCFYLLGLAIKKITVRVLTRRIKDQLLPKFFGRIIHWTFIVVGFLVFLKAVGQGGIAGGILAGAGVGAFIIGFAFKDIGENFLSGIMLAFSRPFQVGDTLEINGIMGKVVSLDLRNTHLKSLDGKDVYIPNSSMVKGNLINYTIDGFLRNEIELGVDYNSDFNYCIDIIMNELKTVDRVLTQKGKEPVVMIHNLGSSSLNFKIYYWIDTFDKKTLPGNIKREIILKLLDKLGKENVYLPGDILEIKNYQNEKIQVAN